MAENNNAILREKCSEILNNRRLSCEEKLYLLYEINKFDLKNIYPSLYYILLEWKDKHRREIMTKSVKEYLK